MNPRAALFLTQPVIRRTKTGMRDSSYLLRSKLVSDFSPVQWKMMAEELAAYHVAHQRVLNLHGTDFSVVHAAPGPDMTSPLLCFDPKEIICVDALLPSRVAFESAREEMFNFVPTDPIPFRGGWLHFPSMKAIILAPEIKEARDFKRKMHHWRMDSIDKYFERLIALELMTLGIEKNRISFEEISDHEIRISFPWAYPGMREEKTRIFRYLKADLTDNSAYPRELRDAIDGGFDGFLMKSAIDCFNKRGKFLSVFSGKARKALLIGAPMERSYIKRSLIPFEGSLQSICGPRFIQDESVNLTFMDGLRNSRSAQFNNNDYGWKMSMWLRNEQ
jgi:hypothetical protein